MESARRQSNRKPTPSGSRRWRAWASALLLVVAGVQAAAPTAWPDVARAVDRGDFRGAEAAIAAALADPTLGDEPRQALAFERERMRRIGLDFSLDRGAVLARLRQAIPDLEEAEFDAWDAAGLVEHLDIDGQRSDQREQRGSQRRPARTDPGLARRCTVLATARIHDDTSRVRW